MTPRLILTTYNFLEGVGFSAKNPYYVIKQGKVQELTVMDDERRLGLMEELSGNAIYEDRRTEALKKLDEVSRKQESTAMKMGGKIILFVASPFPDISVVFVASPFPAISIWVDGPMHRQQVRRGHGVQISFVSEW